MKKTFNYLLTIILIIFSFYYTKIVSDFIKSKDPIMIKIKDNKKYLDKKPNNAIIKDNTIILGSKGKIIDLNKSYSKMKKINKYNESLFVYKEIKPTINLDNSYNYIIVNGDPTFKNIAIIVKIDNIELLNNISNPKINIILSQAFLNDNLKYLNIKNNIIVLEQSNMKNINIISYCYTEDNFNNYCKNYHKYTIKPIFITRDYYYNTYKNISNGKILAYNILNNNDLEELKLIISALKNLNYNIVSIDDLINS